jgi:hypothetical protein
MLLDPVEYSIQNLPKDLKQLITVRIIKFMKKMILDFNYNHEFANQLNQLIEFMNEKDESSRLVLFREQTNKLDKIRNESFQNTYPEIFQYLF